MSARALSELDRVLSRIEALWEMIALRNVYAHYLPDQINPARVWADTEGDLARIRSEVAAAGAEPD